MVNASGPAAAAASGRLPGDPFFLVGPTAVGKSALALELAERVGAEIVGADAFQVYAGLEGLTAAPPAAWRRRVPHHLVAEVPPAEPYHAARYAAEARARLAELARRGRPALVVGGTGLYVRVLIEGLDPLPSPDPALRAALAARPLASLWEELARLDPVAAARVDRHNPRRVVRALEICLLTGQPVSRVRRDWAAAEPGPDLVPDPAPPGPGPDPGVGVGAARGVLLTRERTDLRERVAARVKEMFATGEVLAEVAALVAAPGALGPTAARALGFDPIRRHLAGGSSLAQCREETERATWQYARRQLTWFRRQPPRFPALDLTGLTVAGRAALTADLTRRWRQAGNEPCPPNPT